MEEKNERKEKADILFKKAMDCYTKQEYEEALKYFKASIKYFPNERAELFIKVCENNIPSKSNSNNNNNNTSYKKSYSASSFSTNNTNNNFNNNYNYSHQSSYSSEKSTNTNNSSQQDNNQNDDMKCKELLKKKDYYDILNIKKDANNDEIKRAYKKMAVKFHPDKNHSKLAEECFKKISEAYQCLSDPEKKQFYDKYGNEEEFRQRYYQAHQHHYEEEMDPYDIFEILFGGGAMPRRGGRRARHFHRNDFNVHFNDFGAVNLRGRSILLILIPFILMVVIQILPELISLLKPAPLYQFNRNSIYKYKKRTLKNNIEFFASDKFINKYPSKEDYQSLENKIENDYLNYIYEKCNDVINRKKELEYYMRYSYSRYERQVYKQQIERLNYHYCEQYNHLRNRMK